MDRKFTIQPRAGTAIELPGTYIYQGDSIENSFQKGVQYAITRNFQILMNPKEIKERHSEIWNIPFSPHGLKRHEVKYDTNDPLFKGGFTPQVFYKNHPMVLCDAYKNKNMTIDLFLYQEEHEVSAMETDKILALGKAMGKIAVMRNDRKSLIDVAFCFGLNPTGMILDKLFARLADPVTGVLMTGENLKKFLDYSTTEETIFRTNIRKAILLGILEFKEGLYFANGTPIGKDEDSLAVYLQDNKELYLKFLVPSVNEKEAPLLQEEKDPNRLMNEVGHQIRKGREGIDPLREKASTLKIKYHKTLTESNLLEEIPRAEAILNQAVSMGINIDDFRWYTEVREEIRNKNKKLHPEQKAAKEQMETV